MALVIEADDPLDNLAEARLRRINVTGPESLGVVRILIESEPPIYVARGFELDRDHWPVVGMQLPVTIDPADPGSFEVIWGEVPSMSQRAAANDPTLADPVGSRRRTMEALIAAGVAGSGVSPPQGDDGAALVAGQALAVEMGNSGTLPDHFQESMDRAQRESAPVGRTRAVVLIAASEATSGTPRGGGGGYTKDRHSTPLHRTHQAVLAVNVPGRAPYAVFEPKFEHPGGKGGLVGAGLPALVSSTDPSDVEVLWDELLSIRKQMKQDRQTADAAVSDARERVAQFEARMTEVSSGLPPAPPVVAGPPGTPQIPAQAREMMIKNAKLALQSVPPAMRESLIQQYRMAGITIDENGNITD
jgi:hypothetical protein